MLFVFIMSILRLCIQDSSSWIDPSYRNLTILNVSLFICCSCGDFIKTMLRFLHFPYRPDWDFAEGVAGVINNFFYYCGNIVFYSLLLRRVNETFGLKKCISSFLSTVIFIEALSSICYLLTICLLSGQSIYLGVCAMLMGIADLILNCTLFITFWLKLKNSILGDGDIITKSYEKKVNLIRNIMTKHCVLFGIAIITNQVYFSTIVYNQLIDSNLSIRQNHITSVIIRAFEITVNVCALWLVLRINYNQYICLCRYCHLCIGKCCISKDTSADNPYYQLDDQQL